MEGLVVHDFDDIGVPGAADNRWRQRSMERWLRRVLDYQADGIDVLLLGQSPLGEVLASELAPRMGQQSRCSRRAARAGALRSGMILEC